MILVLFTLHNKCNEFHFFFRFRHAVLGPPWVYLRAWACLWAMLVHPWVLSLTEWHDAAASTVHWAAGEYHTCWTQFHLERNWRTSSHSHIQNLNQISTQSGGTSATLHLTLKWGQVVLVDYRWLVVGWECLEISPEIYLHPFVSICQLTVLPLCPRICHLLCLSLNIEDSFISGNPLFLF